MNSESQSTFRILSLDGGGIRGVVSARILQQVEAQIQAREKKSLTEYFDLVAGTSTGSILAAGIALGKTPENMINLYKNSGGEIFDQGKRRLRNCIPGGGGYLIPFTRYCNEGLKKVLQEQLRFPEGGEHPKLIDVENRDKSPTLLILAYATLQEDRKYSDNSPYKQILASTTQYFDSNGVELEPRRNSWYTEKPIWELCVCSAAAPTFFPPYQLENPFGNFNTYIDGGVSANNPALAAITHALYTKTRVNSSGEPLNLSDISVLSIGTGKVNQPFDFNTVNNWGLIEWARKIPDIFMAAPTDFEDKVTRQLISSFNPRQYLRIDIPLDKSLAAIDDPTKIGELIERTEQSFPEITYYDYQTGTEQTESLENLVENFLANNSRDYETTHFRNRFVPTS